MATVLPIDESANAVADISIGADYVMVEKPQIKVIENVKCYIPVMHNKLQCTWRFECSRFGSNLYISVASELMELHDIQKIEVFQLKTIFGEPKKSMSSRNAFKYCIPIESFYVNYSNGEHLFKTPLLSIHENIMIFEFVVFGENYENTSDHLQIILNKFSEHKLRLRDDLGFMENLSHRSSIILDVHYRTNFEFVSGLFIYKLNKSN